MNLKFLRYHLSHSFFSSEFFFLNSIKFFLSRHDECLHRFFFDFCFDFLNDFYFEKVVINHSNLTHFTKLPLARADDSKRKILIYENTLLFDYYGECTIVLKIKHSSNKIIYNLYTETKILLDNQLLKNVS